MPSSRESNPRITHSNNYPNCSGLHWATRRNEIQGGVVCLAKLRIDGFVSVDTGCRGTLTTKPMVMSGDRLVVNADAHFGMLRVELLDVDGDPIPGYTSDDAVAIRGDNVRQTVSWKAGNDVGSLQGKPISVRFHLDRCRIYSMQFLADD